MLLYSFFCVLCACFVSFVVNLFSREKINGSDDKSEPTQLKKQDVEIFDECMIVGTTVDVTPIIQINDWKVRNGIPGPFTRKIQNEFYKLVMPDENMIDKTKETYEL